MLHVTLTFVKIISCKCIPPKPLDIAATNFAYDVEDAGGQRFVFVLDLMSRSKVK